MRIASSASFFSLVIARDPQILRGMQHGEQAAAVTSLRNFPAADELDYRGQKKPEKLRDGQRKHWKNCAEATPARQRRKGPPAGTHKKQRQNRSRRQSEFNREPQGKNQRIA